MNIFKQFICDKCKKNITSPEDGQIEYVFSTENNGLDAGYKIVHNGCEYYEYQNKGTIELKYLIGENSITELIKKLEENLYGIDNEPVINGTKLKEYIELMKRILIPYYEEARQYFEEAEYDGFYSEMRGSKYEEKNLKKLIIKYSSDEYLTL